MLGTAIRTFSLAMLFLSAPSWATTHVHLNLDESKPGTQAKSDLAVVDGWPVLVVSGPGAAEIREELKTADFVREITDLTLIDAKDSEFRAEDLASLAGKVTEQAKITLIRPEHDPERDPKDARDFAIEAAQKLGVKDLSVTVLHPSAQVVSRARKTLHAVFAAGATLVGLTIAAKEGWIPFEALSANTKLAGAGLMFGTAIPELFNLILPASRSSIHVRIENGELRPGLIKRVGSKLARPFRRPTQPARR